MDFGYSILLWDGWGAGGVRINPRLHTEGEDLYGNPNNWWPCERDTTDEQIIRKHGFASGHLLHIIKD